MFLNRDYRARAIGILGAYAVVIAGVLIGASLESSSTNGASKDTHPTVEPHQANAAKDSLPGSDARCDTVC
jgi:hypothetical protein